MHASARHQRHAELVRRLIETAVDAGHEGHITLGALALDVGVSQWHLQRIFRRCTGVTPAQYTRALRSERFRQRLRGGECVSRAACSAGFASASRMHHVATAYMGMTPAAYRDGGGGVRIRYVIRQSPLAQLLIAATERGVCAIRAGDDVAILEDTLAAEYHNAELERVDDPRSFTEEFAAWVNSILEYVESGRPCLAVPVDVRGTEFQCRVWSALREIPHGETRSYGQVAAAIGAPTAVRAVANACAHNPVALVIPCHRVVRGTGALGGYAWGIERKKILLARECETRDRDAHDQQP